MRFTASPRFTRQKRLVRPNTLRAVEYVRASTDHQQFSIENQRKVISAYAATHNIEIVRSYADPARTGLTLRKRPGLKQLIADIQNAPIDFSLILVFDVSRWGRFQDTDESAYYEFLCKARGVMIRYCNEPFDNDGALINTVIKNVKRAMAGEYSRDLSKRVMLGHRKGVSLGFHQGGVPNFGLRRVLVDDKGRPIKPLADGQQKYLTTDRVILVPGPLEETNVVREIFHLYAEKGLAKKRIARMLNDRGILNGRGNRWSDHTVHSLLSSERYIGNLVYNRSSLSLGSERVIHPESEWIRAEGAIKPVVDRKLFKLAQMRLKNTWPITDNDLLDYLTATWCVNGFLSAKAISESDYGPSICAYCDHFGSISNAYRLVGFKPPHRYRYRGFADLLRRLDHRITAQIIADVERLGGRILLDHDDHVLRLDDHLDVALVLVPYVRGPAHNRGWTLVLAQVQRCHAILLGILNKSNTDIQDYFLMPRCIFLRRTFRFATGNLGQFASYKLDGLSDLYPNYKRNYFGEKVGPLPAYLPLLPLIERPADESKSDELWPG